MTAKRLARRTATLDEFLAAAREAARRVREQQVDLEALISRLAEEAAKRAAAMVVERLERSLERSIHEQTEVVKSIERIVRSVVSDAVATALQPINKRLDELAMEVRTLRSTVERLESRGVGERRSEERRLPPWARKLAKMLEDRPFIRLHELGIDIYQVKGEPSVLRELDAVLVEIMNGVYLVKRSEWTKLLEKLESVKSRDEEEAVRIAGPLAEIVAALLRDNLLYYNNGWRVYPRAFLNPE